MDCSRSWKDAIWKALGVLYFALFIISWMIYKNRLNTYVRPTLYFLVLSVMAGIIFVQIVHLKQTNMFLKFLIFFESFLTYLSYTLTQQLSYVTVLSRDPWAHWFFTENIIKLGHIPSQEVVKTPYSKMPIFHILLSVSSILSNIGYKWIQYTVVGIVVALLLYLGIMLTYQIGLQNMYFEPESSRMIFLGSTLVLLSDNILDLYGKNIIPNSLGIAIVILLSYLLLKKNIGWKVYSLILIMISMLVLEHSVSYMFFIMTAAYIFLIGIIFNEKSTVKNLGLWIILALVLGVLEWAYISGFYFKNLVVIIKGFVEFSLKGSSTKYESHLAVPIFDVVLSRSGMLVFFGLASLGVIYVLLPNYNDKRKKSREITTLGILAMTFIASSFISVIVPTFTEIAHRFWAYSEVIGGLFVSVVIYNIYRTHKFLTFKLPQVGTFLLVILLSFLMFSAQIASNDSPTVKKYVIRSGLRETELSCVLFFWQSYEPYQVLSILSDYDYLLSFNYIFATNLIPLHRDLIKGYPWVPPTAPWIIKPLPFPRGLNSIFVSEYPTQSVKYQYYVLRIEFLKDSAFVLGDRWHMLTHPPIGNEVLKLIREGQFKTDATIYDNADVIVFYKNRGGEQS